jgi:alpha-ketoglutarate-dependent 2,4-dichlorophenoxyacetate dioxygenase
MEEPVITIDKLHPLFVARFTGIQLSQPIEVPTFERILSTMDEHAVGIFQGPTLDEEDQIAFASRFGALEQQNGVLTTGVKARVSRRLVDISNLDENNTLLAQADRRRMFALGNQLWHTDSSFKRTPAKYSLLHAHSVVPEGGETQFVDMRAAYDALSPKMKVTIENLVAEHSIFHSRAKLGFTEFSDEERRATPPVHRSLVRVHAGSGRKTLYLASHASHIVGWPVPDGRMLIRELMEHATQPQFVYTHRWAVGDLIIWDNRCTMHRGRPYDQVLHRRDLRRATIQDLDPAVQDLRVA